MPNKKHEGNQRNQAEEERTQELTQINEQLQQEITERKHMEEKLQKREMRLQSIINNSAIGITLLDANHRLVEVNPTLLDMLGYSKEELFSMASPEAITHPDDFAVETKLSREIFEGKRDQFQIEKRYIRKDGQLIYGNLTASLVRDNQGIPQFFLGMVENITERKLAEEKLEAERQKLFSILDGLGAFVYIQAPDYSIRYNNKHFKKLFGETKGKICYEVLWNRKTPCDPCPTFRVFDTKSTQKWEWTRPEDGRIYQIYDYPFKDLDGSALVLELGIDITERRFAEEELKARQKEIEEINTNLGNLVQEEMEKSRQKDYIMIQQSRLAAMGEMIKYITHQWGQPLWALQLLLYNLTDLIQNTESEEKEVDDLLAKGLQLVNGMFTTMDDFKSFFQANKEKVSFSINKNIKNTFSLMGGSLKYSNISVSFNEKDEITVWGFPNEYSQVILNIIKNAQDAIVEKGINGKIKIDILYEGDSAIVKIKDNGGGIPEDILDKIFDSYFSTKTEGQGSGIGLYMSKVIIEEHMNGSINVKNTEEGAEFEITTPMIQS